ncbi:hypothetical protein ABW20_dc0109586 [Dactylellina cionopaga]|nr:hypothetical protein ABW20_dc0109586 [Dactylellina cionopaga]
MKSFTQIIVVSLLAIGATAQSYSSAPPPTYGAGAATTVSTVATPASATTSAAPTGATECPVTPDASCAFLCVPQFGGAKYCTPTNPGQNAGVLCTSCSNEAPPAAGNGSTTAVPPPVYTTTAPSGNGTSSTPPVPTYTSGASALSMGGAAVFGVLCIMLAL